MRQHIPSLSLAPARRLIGAAKKKAGQLSIPCNIAVADAGGNLIPHARSSINISINKARTARAFDMPTGALSKMAQSGKPSFCINSTNHDKVVIVAGGAPITVGNTVIGALGASGGTSDQDQKVADAALQAYQSNH
jgi:uncharacterized protein GlcG (DUF336 family)